MAEKIYAAGIKCFPKRDKAPDFVLGSVVISPDDLNAWCIDNKDLLSEYKGKKQLRLDLLQGKEGPYLSVNTFKKQEQSEDLPF